MLGKIKQPNGEGTIGSLGGLFEKPWCKSRCGQDVNLASAIRQGCPRQVKADSAALRDSLAQRIVKSIGPFLWRASIVGTTSVGPNLWNKSSGNFHRASIELVAQRKLLICESNLIQRLETSGIEWRPMIWTQLSLSYIWNQSKTFACGPGIHAQNGTILSSDTPFEWGAAEPTSRCGTRVTWMDSVLGRGFVISAPRF